MKNILIAAVLLIVIPGKAQTCNCEKEFLYVKNIVDENFSGFPDRIKTLSYAVYKKKTDQLLKLTRGRFASDNCPLIIDQYLDVFKSHHLGFFSNSDPYKTDTDFVNHRPLFNIPDDKLARLRKSKSWEGIYISAFDSSYKIAVIKDQTPLHDYIGVLVQSKLPTWKKGMVKFEGKLVNDSLLKGVLYMRNHRPKFESFDLWDNQNKIGGDWVRQGTGKEVSNLPAQGSHSVPSPTTDAKRLTPNTFYVKIGSFSNTYKPQIDSILKANESLLNATANLVLDLRDNGGGSDDSWEGLIPYIYSSPIKMIGADVLATKTTISAYKKYLDDKNLSKETLNNINNEIAKMEKAEGRWVKKNDDEVISYLTPKPFPKKVVILINKWCGSSTEELLLATQQSSKVVLAGENTTGNLDYSNVVEVPFSCYPYTLVYATTRSRRLNVHKGIDNIGIAPSYRLTEKDDWIKEAIKIAEGQR